MSELLSIFILAGWGLLPAWLLWRQAPFVEAVPVSSLQQALWQTLWTALLCWLLDAWQLGLIGFAIFVLVLQPLLLLFGWPLQLFLNRVRNCDPLREKI